MNKIIFTFSILLFLSGCHIFTKEETSNRKILINTETNILKKEKPLKVITIIEFFDFGCGHCKTANDNLKTLKLKFGDKIKIEQKHFPLRPTTFFAAEASECARRQNKYESFKDMIFENFGVYSLTKMTEIAQTLELNMKDFETCIKSGSAKQYVQKQVTEGEVLGIHGIPFFVINNEIQIPGNLPIKTFEKLIQKILN